MVFKTTIKMQYNPYNPYINNNHQNPNVATAPPLDDVNYTHQAPQSYIYVQHPYPVYSIYSYPNTPHNSPVQQQQHNQDIQMRKEQEDDCCCFGLMALLCCCFF